MKMSGKSIIVFLVLGICIFSFGVTAGSAPKSPPSPTPQPRIIETPPPPAKEVKGTDTQKAPEPVKCVPTELNRTCSGCKTALVITMNAECIEIPSNIEDLSCIAACPKPVVAPTPAPQPEPMYFQPSPQPSTGCCKICTTGKACGDSCISRNYTCHKGPGCACNG